MDKIHSSVKSRKEYPVILTILFLAGLVRLANLDFLLGYFVIPDEYELASSVVNVKINNLFHPLSFKYGSFPIYWSSLIFNIINYLFPSLNGNAPGSSLFYLGRITSAMFGLASIYVFFLIARRLLGLKAGYLSAFLLSISPLHIFFSQIYKVDISLLLWILLVFYFSIRIREEKKMRYYVLSGIFIGLSFSTKYIFLAFVPVLVAYLQSEKIISLSLVKLFTSVYVALIFGFLSCPYCFLEIDQLLKQMNILYSQQNVLFMRNPIGFLPHSALQAVFALGFLFPLLFNPAIYLYSLAGGYHLFRNRRGDFLLIAAFPLLYLLLVLLSTKLILFPQQFLPIFPFVILLCSYYVFNRIGSVKSIRCIILVLFVAFDILNIFVPVAYYKVYLRHYENVGKWMQREIPVNSEVVGYYNFLNPSESPGLKNNRIGQPKNFNLSVLENTQPDYIIMEIRPDLLENDYGRMFYLLKNGMIDYQVVKKFEIPAVEAIGRIVKSPDIYATYVFHKVGREDLKAGDLARKAELIRTKKLEFPGYLWDLLFPPGRSCLLIDPGPGG